MKSVLVIEADHETRVTIRRILEEAGYFVVSVANGQEALSIVSRISVPSMILLNFRTPFVSENFLSEIRAHPEYRSVLVAQLIKAGETQLDGTCCTLNVPLQRGPLLKAVQVCR